MNSFTVTVERGDGVWLASCDGVAYTQARRLSEVEPMIREAISLMQDMPEAQIHLDIT